MTNVNIFLSSTDSNTMCRTKHRHYKSQFRTAAYIFSESVASVITHNELLHNLDLNYIFSSNMSNLILK